MFISLLNSSLKLVTKLLASRLQGSLTSFTKTSMVHPAKKGLSSVVGPSKIASFVFSKKTQETIVLTFYFGKASYTLITTLPQGFWSIWALMGITPSFPPVHVYYTS